MLLFGVYEAFYDVFIGIDATVAQEGPPLSDGFCALQVNIYDDGFLLGVACLIE